MKHDQKTRTCSETPVTIYIYFPLLENYSSVFQLLCDAVEGKTNLEKITMNSKKCQYGTTLRRWTERARAEHNIDIII